MMFDNKYPYTDYHELNLDWFMGEFKKLVAEWEETKGEWNTLHDFVQNYFDNLNVQTEIDNKINAMIADGSFATIVTPLVEAALPTIVDGKLPAVVATQISAVVAAQIDAVVAGQLPAVAAQAAADEVGTWLAAHIDPDTGYVIDNTLTVNNAAANAKTVGDILLPLDDMVGYIENDISSIYNVLQDFNAPISTTLVQDKFLLYTTGAEQGSTNSGYVKIDVTPGKRYYVTTQITGNRGICFYHDNTYISGFNESTSGSILTDYEIIIPPGCNKLGISTYHYIAAPITVRTKSNLNVKSLFPVVGYEKYTFLTGKAVITPTSGTADLTPVDIDSVSCCIIDCNKGDVFTLNGTPRNNSGTRPYMFVDSDDTVVYRSERTAAMVDYTVIAPVTGKLVVNFLKNDSKSAVKGYINISKKLSDYFIFKNEPLTNLPAYFVNNLSYKPIGALDKGYLCLSCDDGAVELATYTIPMIEAKDVPCTFALWSTSAVFTDYTSDVVDAIENHNCELAQHGNQTWAGSDGSTTFSESQLRNFFNSEKTFWDSLGIEAKSAVCPAHYNNAMVRAVAGGTFGVVRSGVNYVDNYYTNYTSGARSNIFGMSSQNINGGLLDYWKGVIDYAYAEHKIVNLYWHDWDLDAAGKAKLEAVIDYAKAKGISFCTLGDIAHIL